MADILNTVSIAAFVLAVVFAVLAVVCWFSYDIRKIIGELSGRTARKSIANMRRRNEHTGTAVLKPETALLRSEQSEVREVNNGTE